MSLSRFLLITLILLSTKSFAQVRKYSNEFLQIGVGARSLGMSGAVAASTNDVTATYWNPAGLSSMSSRAQLGLMHSEYFAGIAKYDYGAFATKIDSLSAFGFSVVRFGVDDIPNTIELIDVNGVVDYSRITSFSIADYAFMFTYSRKLKIPGLSFGANAKIIHRIIGDFGRSWGFGMDAGLQYKRNRWNFGLMGRDITTTFNAWSYTLNDRTKEVFTQTGNEIPSNSTELTAPKIILAGGYLYPINDKFAVLAEINTDLMFDGMHNTVIKGNHFNVDPKAGLEFSYLNTVFIRGGVGNIQKSSDEKGKTFTTYQPNFGVGIKLKGFTIDYALTDIGDQSVALYSNVFSLKIDLNQKRK